MLAYRLEVALEVSGQRILPEIYLIGELCLGHFESLGSDMDVLKAIFVRKMNKGQRNVIGIEALDGSVRNGSKAEFVRIPHHRNSN